MLRSSCCEVLSFAFASPAPTWRRRQTPPWQSIAEPARRERKSLVRVPPAQSEVRRSGGVPTGRSRFGNDGGGTDGAGGLADHAVRFSGPAAGAALSTGRRILPRRQIGASRQRGKRTVRAERGPRSSDGHDQAVGALRNNTTARVRWSLQKSPVCRGLTRDAQRTPSEPPCVHDNPAGNYLPIPTGAGRLS